MSGIWIDTFSFGEVGLGTTSIYAIRHIFYFAPEQLRMLQMGENFGGGNWKTVSLFTSMIQMNIFLICLNQWRYSRFGSHGTLILRSINECIRIRRGEILIRGNKANIYYFPQKNTLVPLSHFWASPSPYKYSNQEELGTGQGYEKGKRYSYSRHARQIYTFPLLLSVAVPWFPFLKWNRLRPLHYYIIHMPRLWSDNFFNSP